MTYPNNLGISNEALDRLDASLPDIPREQIMQVLAQTNATIGAATKGTVIINHETKEIAHRVNEGGIDRWRVSPEDAPYWNDDDPGHAGMIPGFEMLIDTSEEK